MSSFSAIATIINIIIPPSATSALLAMASMTIPTDISNTTLIILASNMSTPQPQTPRRIAVEGLRSDGDIKSFRRRLPTILASNDTSMAVEIFFKGSGERSSAGVPSGSKDKFEKRVRDCLDAGKPMSINYRLRPKAAQPTGTPSTTTTTTTTPESNKEPMTFQQNLAGLVKCISELQTENRKLKAELAAKNTPVSDTQCSKVSADRPTQKADLKEKACGIAQTMSKFLDAYSTVSGMKRKGSCVLAC